MTKATIEITDLANSEEVGVKVMFEPGIARAKELKHLSHYLATIATAAIMEKLDKMAENNDRKMGKAKVRILKKGKLH